MSATLEVSPLIIIPFGLARITLYALSMNNPGPGLLPTKNGGRMREAAARELPDQRPLFLNSLWRTDVREFQD